MNILRTFLEFILHDIQFNSLFSINYLLNITEGGMTFLFLWNKSECCGINFGCDIIKKNVEFKTPQAGSPSSQLLYVCCIYDFYVAMC